MNFSQESLASDVLKGADAIAAFIGVPRRSVYHAVANGSLPTFRLGETILARKSTLLRWIGEQEQAASPTKMAA